MGKVDTSIILGAIVGASLGAVIFLANLPLSLLAIAPFAAGLIAGSVRGGAKAGILTIIVMSVFLVPTFIVSANASGQPPNAPKISTVDIAGGALSVLTSGFVDSATTAISGLVAFFTLDQVIAILPILFSVLIVGIGIAASTMFGAVGGAIGRFIRA